MNNHLSNNGCNGLVGARNRRESAFRSRPSCKSATRVGGDDRRRSVRLGAVLVVSGREEWAGCPRQEVPNFAPLMRLCLIAHLAMLLRADCNSAVLRFLKTEQRYRPDFLADTLSALIPHGVAEKRLLDVMLLAAPK